MNIHDCGLEVVEVNPANVTVTRPKMHNYIKMCGIYAIINIFTREAYIGSSIDILDRYLGHVRALDGNRHGNKYLQEAWNRDGNDAFFLEVLELCDADILRTRENAWLPLATYNISDSSARPPLGFQHSVQSRRRMSESARERIANRTEEEWRIISMHMSEGSKRRWKEMGDEERERFHSRNVDNLRRGAAKRSVSVKGNPDFKEKASKAATRRWQDPDVGPRLAEAGRKNLAKFAEDRQRDPAIHEEWCRKISEGRKRGIAKRKKEKDKNDADEPSES
jgi:group I intron endonuclease